MTAFTANPYVFVFSGLLLLAVLGYYGWGAVDQLALAEEEASAVVTGKHHNPPGVTYRSNVVAGRNWTQVDATEETYVLTLDVGKQTAVAVVGKPLHDALQPGDRVRVRLRRTRLSGRLQITEVSR